MSLSKSRFRCFFHDIMKDPSNWRWNEIIQLAQDENADVSILADAARILLKFTQQEFASFQCMKKSANLHKICRGDAILRNIYVQIKRKTFRPTRHRYTVLQWETFEDLIETKFCGLVNGKSQIAHADALHCKGFIEAMARKKFK